MSGLPAFARNFRNTPGGLLTFCLDFRFSRERQETKQGTAAPARAAESLLADLWCSREASGTRPADCSRFASTSGFRPQLPERELRPRGNRSLRPRGDHPEAGALPRQACLPRNRPIWPPGACPEAGALPRQAPLRRNRSLRLPGACFEAGALPRQAAYVEIDPFGLPGPPGACFAAGTLPPTRKSIPLASRGLRQGRFRGLRVTCALSVLPAFARNCWTTTGGLLHYVSTSSFRRNSRNTAGGSLTVCVDFLLSRKISGTLPHYLRVCIDFKFSREALSFGTSAFASHAGHPDPGSGPRAL